MNNDNLPWFSLDQDGPILLGTLVFASVMMTAIWIGFAPDPVECDPALLPECHPSLSEQDRDRLAPGKVIAAYVVIRSTGVI